MLFIDLFTCLFSVNPYSFLSYTGITMKKRSYSILLLTVSTPTSILPGMYDMR